MRVHKTTGKPLNKYLLRVVSTSIMIAVTISTVKLFRIWLLMTGEPSVGFTTALLFWVLGTVAHFGTRALGTISRVMAFGLLYALKLVSSFIYSMLVHAPEIHQFVLNTKNLGRHLTLAGDFTKSGGDVADMAIFLLGSHPSGIIAGICLTFGFLVVGDIMAIVLEILHRSLQR